MKKFVLPLFLFVVSVVFIGVEQVEAKQCTDTYAAPHLYQVAPDKRSDTYKLKTAATACKGSNTEVWFSAFKSLPANYAFDTGNVWVYLYEEDPAGNDDERVKEYVGWINGHVLTDFTLNRTFITGLIDSEGDKTCELYLTFGISGKFGGPSVEKSLFNYSVCMN